MDEPIVLDKPSQIEKVRLHVIWQCVKTDHETDGRISLTRVYRLSAVKKEFGLKGDRHKVYAELTKLFLANGVLTGCPNHPDRLPASRRVSNLCAECLGHGGLKVVK